MSCICSKRSTLIIWQLFSSRTSIKLLYQFLNLMLILFCPFWLFFVSFRPYASVRSGLLQSFPAPRAGQGLRGKSPAGIGTRFVFSGLDLCVSVFVFYFSLFIISAQLRVQYKQYKNKMSPQIKVQCVWKHTFSSFSLSKTMMLMQE